MDTIANTPNNVLRVAGYLLALLLVVFLVAWATYSEGHKAGHKAGKVEQTTRDAALHEKAIANARKDGACQVLNAAFPVLIRGADQADTVTLVNKMTDCVAFYNEQGTREGK